MIRNVVMGRLQDASDETAVSELERGLAGIRGLDLAGQLAMSVGRDAGVRDGGWDFAIINDWADVDAYRNYDVDDEHNVYRAIIGAVCAEVARVQFEVTD